MEYSIRPSQRAFCPKGLQEENIMWNHGVAILFHSKYRYDQLNDAFNSMIQTFEELRLQFFWSDGILKSRVADFLPVQYPYETFLSRQELPCAVNKLIDLPFDLSDTLFRCVVFHTAEESGFLIAAHHILIDGYSTQVMADFIQDALNAHSSTSFSIIPYSHWMEADAAYRASARYQRDLLYWQEQLPVMSYCPIFPADAFSKGYHCKEQVQTLPSDFFRQVANFSQQAGISMASFFVTVLGIWAQREFALSTFVSGFPVLGRTTQAQYTSPGLHMNILPLFVDLSCGSFLDCVKKTEQQKMDIFRHQRFTMADIEALPTFSHEQHRTLFEFVFDYQDFPECEHRELIFSYSHALSVPLEIHLHNYGHLQKLHVRYRSALFSDEQIQDFLECFRCIATAAMEQPHLQPSKLPQYVLSTADRQKLLVSFNQTHHTYSVPEDSTLYQLFDTYASRHPDIVCLTAGGQDISFRQLRNYAEILDSSIMQVTKGKKSIIAVIAERSIEMYTAIYAIVRGGNAYLPIDPSFPQERIAYILRNSNAAAVMVQQSFRHMAGSVFSIDVTDVLLHPAPTCPAPPIAAQPDDTAYVIYTSGSTGNPKGVMVSNRSAVNRILWMQERYPLDFSSVILQKTPYTFDVSVWELFWWGMCGGCLAASAPNEHFLPAKILRDVHAHNVTHLHFVPSVFDIFLTYLEHDPSRKFLFSSVKHIFLSGEALTADLIHRFYALFPYPSVQLHNLYGPTECAVDVTYYDCTPEDTDPVPIGRPIFNTMAYILDSAMEPLPLGKQGELCIGGINVGQGYLNAPDLTAENFLQNPFAPGKLYKTGDYASFRPDGQILFHGRMDGQIKLNGQRIELSEIESVLHQYSGIDSVAVIPHSRPGGDYLIAFFSGSASDAGQLREHCKARLPDYMVPVYFIQLDKMPLNSSGKLDRKKLKQFVLSTPDKTQIDPPQDEVEAFFCNAFSKELKLASVGRSSSFFSLGGTSLSMISLLSSDGFQHITPAVFIENPTPAALAQQTKIFALSQVTPLKVLRKAPDNAPTLLLIPYAGGGAEAYSMLVSSFQRLNCPLSVLYVDYPKSNAECRQIAEAIALLHDTSQILIYSHCAGAAPAMQIILYLEQISPEIFVRYISGGSIPPANLGSENPWNHISDHELKQILEQAGASFGELPDVQIHKMLQQFRTDTDFMTLFFSRSPQKIHCPTTILLSKKDLFTQNYQDAERLWEPYTTKLNPPVFIESNSHYFQSTHAEIVCDILLSHIVNTTDVSRK